MVILIIYVALKLDFRKMRPMKIAKISQNEEITASKIVKVAIFETLDLPQLISRKIVAVKFSNFHTVQSKLIHNEPH